MLGVRGKAPLSNQSQLLSRVSASASTAFLRAMETIRKLLGLESESWGGSLARKEDENTQAYAVKVAAQEGFRGGAVALAASSAVILGACKLFPRFNRSLSVSGKTALIVSPAFGAFFLLSELKMNEFKKKKLQVAGQVPS